MKLPTARRTAALLSAWVLLAPAPCRAAEEASPAATPGAPAASSEAAPQEPSLREVYVPDVSLGGEHVVIHQGEVKNGDLVMLGGSLDLDGVVRGEVILIGARARIAGTIEDDVVSVASSVELTDTARLAGQLVSVVGSSQIPPGAVLGQNPVRIELIDLSRFARGGSFLTFIIWLALWVALIKAAFLALAILIVTALLAQRIDFAASMLPRCWGRSLIAGFVVTALVWICILIFAVTVIGIPIAVLAWMGLIFVKWTGLASIYALTGGQLGRNVLGRELSVMSRALLGCLLFLFVSLVPVVGGLIGLVLGLVGIGLMTLTRLGTRPPSSSLDALTAAGGGSPAGAAGPA